MKIVIIDDESVICNGLQKIIESSEKGWTVEDVYTDPEEALEFCDWDSIDLLLADINMPNVDGLSLVDTLRKRGYDTQVIFVSGYTEFDYAKKAIQQKAVDYIIKPVSVQSLKNAIIKAEEIRNQKKKMLSDEEFIRKNITAITKSFIFDMMFETKRLSQNEVEKSIRCCGLQNSRFSLISFMLQDDDKIENIVASFLRDNIRIFLYTGNRQYRIIILCEEKNKCSRVEAVIGEIRNSFPLLHVGQIKSTESVYDLADINYELMAQYKAETHQCDKLCRNDSYEYKYKDHREEYSTHIISAIEYIKDNYSKKISLSSLSEELYVHPTYLSNLFKKQTGSTIVDYINNYRIEIAKDLLKDSRNKIFWVAEQVGFVNQKYFSEKFKKNTGYTPVEYKQRTFFAGR